MADVPTEQATAPVANSPALPEVPPPPSSGLPAFVHPTVINAYTELAKAMVRTNLPTGVSTWETALRIMLSGYEAGLPPMASLNDLHTTGPDGKIAMDTRAKVALVRTRGLGTITLVETGLKGATVEIHRNDWALERTERVSFTREDAEKAGLLDTHPNGQIKKKNWRCYESDMYVARAYGRGCNYHFQEIMFHTPDELGMETDRWGDAIDLEPTAPPKPPWEESGDDPERTEPPATADAAVAGEAASEEEPAAPSAALPDAALANALAPPKPDALATPAQLNELAVLVRAVKLSVEDYRPWIRRMTGVDSAKEAPSVKLAYAIEVLAAIKQTYDYCESAKKDGPASLAKAASNRGVESALDLDIAALREIREKARLAAGDPLR